MKSLKEVINEGFITEKYDKEILQDILDALNHLEHYNAYSVDFCDEDGHTGYLMVVKSILSNDRQKSFEKYFYRLTDFVNHIVSLDQYDIRNKFEFCRKMPSTFYCCKLWFDDEDATWGYLFTNVEDGAEKRTFEKFLNKHLHCIDVI